MHIELGEPDLDEPQTVGYCAHCEGNVYAVKHDAGLGYEYGSDRGYHVVLCDVCPTCGEEVGPAQRDDEYENED